MRRLGLSLLALACLAGSPAAQTYRIDPDHSKVMFRVRHLVGKVTGRFNKFEGSFDYEPGRPKAWKAWARIEAGSIDTGVEKRDSHLRTADFFDAEKCPALEFKSSKVTGVQGERARLHGDLAIHCVSRPVVLDLELGGVAKDPWGNTRAGATATGSINRKDFGLTWNKTLDAGGLLIGDEVEIMLEIEGIAAK